MRDRLGGGAAADDLFDRYGNVLNVWDLFAELADTPLAALRIGGPPQWPGVGQMWRVAPAWQGATAATPPGAARRPPSSGPPWYNRV